MGTRFYEYTTTECFSFRTKFRLDILRYTFVRISKHIFSALLSNILFSSCNNEASFLLASKY